MTRRCVILGKGRVAAEVAKHLISSNTTCELAAWKSASFSFKDIVTVPENFRLGNINRFISPLKACGINELILVGRFDPKEDKTNPDELTTNMLVKEFGTFSASGYLRSAKLQLKRIAGIDIVPLGRITTYFTPDSRFRKATEGELVSVAKLLEAVEKQKGPHISDSAIFNGRKFVLEQEGGTDGLLSKAASDFHTSKGTRSLVKISGDVLGDIAPPVIGPETLRLCRAAGIGKIIIAKRNSIIAERNRFYETANDLGIDLVAV